MKSKRASNQSERMRAIPIGFQNRTMSDWTTMAFERSTPNQGRINPANRIEQRAKKKKRSTGIN
jgi:hypothetical protein